MRRLFDGLNEILFLTERYHLASENLRQTVLEMEHFFVTVPVIGSFNVGKSALLNALLEMRLLPVGIEATTVLPTELTCGENGVTVCRDDCTQKAGLGEFRSRQLDLRGASLLRVSCDNPFLRRIENIRLVDMPGLDSSLTRPEQTLRRYLSDSLACLLVFSADEPVVKQSVASFLSQLRLHEIPVLVALTKCDKVTPDELDRAAAFLKQSLMRLFQLSDVSICRVSARGGVEEVADMLLGLQKRADEMARRHLTQQLRTACLSLQSYLSLREDVARVPVSELESRKKMLDSRMEQLRGLLQQEELRLHHQVASAGEDQLKRLRRCLEEATEPMVGMLLAGQNPAEYVDGLLSSAVSAAVANVFEPAARRCLKSVAGLLRMQSLSRSGEPEAPACAALRQFSDKRRLTVDPAQFPLEKTKSLFDPLCGPPAASARSAGRRESLLEQVEQVILPRLFSMTYRCAVWVMRQGTTLVHYAVEAAVAEEYQALQKALDDAGAAQRPADSLCGADPAQMSADLESVRRLLKLCGSVALDTQTGGDAYGGDFSENRSAAATV